MILEVVIILLLAVILDLLFGDPPNALHPVYWTGQVISRFEEHGIGKKPRHQLILGVLAVILLSAALAAGVYYLLEYLQGVNNILFIVISAILLKMTFCIKGLRKVALSIKKLLTEEKRDKSKFEMRALVSRDTSKLSDEKLVSGVVESVAESSVDSLVAPLFYFIIFGVPGAVAYRVVNTFDSMIGYHGKYEYLGKFAARLDDVLNCIPARIGAFILILAAFISRKNGKNAYRVALRDKGKTESPNAGWPMAAAAGALEVKLEKPGSYELGDEIKPLDVNTIDAMLLVFGYTAFITVLMYSLIGVFLNVN